ncbi:Dabb family protein [Sabulilitoribacter arenilitoris]|uniref:Dabb family protein n=1 Tax=Wocania arenilitoris TaxID=2044858 RepID=A0AAE3ESJ7_9FLAO|nr:Dabb family protein [Wocania arenilitoris]MCF7569325.1 Dabb family protein [Wocania arenilitoris]
MNDYFKHTVFFWLKEPENQSNRKTFETSLKKFINTSTYIQSKHIGIPAETNREVIDSSYTYCLSLGFSSKENQDKYQEEPAHKVFIQESCQLWHKVVVYDSISIF